MLTSSKIIPPSDASTTIPADVFDCDLNRKYPATSIAKMRIVGRIRFASNRNMMMHNADTAPAKFLCPRNPRQLPISAVAMPSSLIRCMPTIGSSTTTTYEISTDASKE